MIYTFKSKEDTLRFDNWVRDAKEKEWTVTLIKTKKRRTSLQNNAIWLYCEILSKELNDAGLYLPVDFLGSKYQRSWTKSSVMELIWRPMQEGLFKKESTTDLETDQVGKVYEEINRALSETYGLFVDFPRWDRFQ